MREEAREALLLERAQQGDREAFWELAAPGVEPLLRLAQRVVRSREDAEDVIQETMLRALDSIDEFRGQSRFTTWLHRIAINQSLMKIRRRRSDVFSLDQPRDEDSDRGIDLAAWSDSALDELLSREAQEVLDEELRRLPLDLRTVIVLRDLNGLSPDEVAQALELPPGAVKWRLEKGREILRDRLGAYFRDQKRKHRTGRPEA